MAEVEFQNFLLRLDLLDVDFECYWVIRTPDWLTLAEFYHCFQTILDWPESDDYAFDFEDATYRPSRVRARDTRRTYLAEAFSDSENAYFHIHKSGADWCFQLRCVMVCSDVSCTVSLLHGEEFPPPADCRDLEDYVARYRMGDLTRRGPAEETERRLQPLEQNQTNWIGPFRSKGMTLFQALVATLMERSNRPASAEEIEARLYWSDYDRALTPASIRRVAKRLPLVQDKRGRISLNEECPEFQNALKELEPFRDPADGVKLLVKRFSFHSNDEDVEGRDVVLVVDSAEEKVQGVEVCNELDGLKPYLDAIQRARKRVPRAHALVVDEDELDLELASMLDLPVELRFSLEELVEPFLTQVEIEGETCEYPDNLSHRDLVKFCEEAQRFLLLSPWSFISEFEVFCLEGVASRPIYALVLGYNFQMYGLSLFFEFGEVLRLLRGERPAHPHCFMDFPSTLDSKKLRQTLDREQIPYLSRDACPYVYGNRRTAGPEQYQLVTKVLQAVSDRLSPISGPVMGMVSSGEVLITWPIDLSFAM